MFPNELAESCKGWVSLYLATSDVKTAESSGFDATLQFGILSKKKDFIKSCKIEKSKKTSLLDAYSGNFISHGEFFDPDNEYYCDGKFTIFCDVRISN